MNKKQQQQLKFIAESCLGKVARHLRLLGIDCVWDDGFNAFYVLFQAKQENRIILVQSNEFLQKIIKENSKLTKKAISPLTKQLQAVLYSTSATKEKVGFF